MRTCVGQAVRVMRDGRGEFFFWLLEAVESVKIAACASNRYKTYEYGKQARVGA
jgi:hypothetical protein